MKIGRLIDANFNRTREGIRVIEDVIRFLLDDQELLVEAKNLRLGLGEVNSILDNQLHLINHRDTINDVGTQVTLKAEQERSDIKAVLIANFKRVQESLRVLEEILKLLNVEASQKCKAFRYQTYELEYQTMKKFNEGGKKHMIAGIINNLAKVRETKPLIHHLTNYVTVNDCANITLQIGGLPVMADAIEEVAEMQQISNALVLNIGTLNTELVKSMITAGQKANSLGHRVILDPVGVGATSMRTTKVGKILANVKVDIIKGNLAEIGILVGLEAIVRGVEAGEVSGDIMTAAQDFARKHQTTIAVTGKQDMIINSSKTAVISNGHAMMGKISGTGCMGSSILGAFAAVCDDMFQAAVAALACFGIAGELAALTNPPGPLAYKTALMDCVYGLNADLINQYARVKTL